MSIPREDLLSTEFKTTKKLQNLVFPFIMGYYKLNERIRTPKVNAIFGSILILSKGI